MRARGALLLGTAPFAPGVARAAFLSGEALDKAADVIAILVLCVVPIAIAVLFWLVHVLPEKIAERREHPQKDAIHAVCTLSLFFGGLLWPVAWIWAYAKPVGYKLAYGTDKHDDYFKKEAETLMQAPVPAVALRHLREQLDAIELKGGLSVPLRDIRAQLQRLELDAVQEAGKATETRVEPRPERVG
jgi:hypothetical protein